MHVFLDTYWAAMQVIMDRVEVLELKVHLSITPTLTQWALAGNTTMRDLITNPQSPGRYTPNSYADIYRVCL